MKVIITLAAILWSTLAKPSSWTPYKTVSDKDFALVSNIVEVKNLPRVRSQDHLGICYGMSAQLIAQHYYCERMKLDCSRLSMKQEISPLSTTAYAYSSDTPDKTGGIGSFRSLDLKNGGSPFNVLKNSFQHFTFHADSCFPFDQVTERYGTDENAMNTVLKSLEEIYDKNKRTAAGTDSCVECVQKAIKKSFGVDISNDATVRALRRKTFDEFIYSVTIGNFDCEDMIALPHKDLPMLKFWPTTKDNVTYKEMMNYLVSALKLGRPVDVSGICAIKNQSGDCLEGHALAITGYRKQCTPNGLCREVVRVQNSGGIDWQKAHKDGWIDAETLFDKSGKHILSHLVPRSELASQQ